eukprot:scaffold1891_cov79-Isochrysis_galbana.AAC.1
MGALLLLPHQHRRHFAPCKLGEAQRLDQRCRRGRVDQKRAEDGDAGVQQRDAFEPNHARESAASSAAGEHCPRLRRLRRRRHVAVDDRVVCVDGQCQGEPDGAAEAPPGTHDGLAPGETVVGLGDEGKEEEEHEGAVGGHDGVDGHADKGV